MEEPGGLRSIGLQHNQHNLQLDTTEATAHSTRSGQKKVENGFGKGEKVNDHHRHHLDQSQGQIQASIELSLLALRSYFPKWGRGVGLCIT